MCASIVAARRHFLRRAPLCGLGPGFNPAHQLPFSRKLSADPQPAHTDVVLAEHAEDFIFSEPTALGESGEGLPSVIGLRPGFVGLKHRPRDLSESWVLISKVVEDRKHLQRMYPND